MVKTFVLSPERTFKRTILESILARRREKRLEKKDIIKIERYELSRDGVGEPVEHGVAGSVIGSREDVGQRAREGEVIRGRISRRREHRRRGEPVADVDHVDGAVAHARFARAARQHDDAVAPNGN